MWAFLVGIAVLILSGALAWSNLSQLADASTRVEHTHRVLRSTSEALALLRAAETAQRTQLVAGTSAFAPRRQDVRPLIEQELQRLAVLTTDNLAQAARVKTLSMVSRDLLQHFEASTLLLQSPSADARTAVQTLLEQDQALMERVNEISAQIRSEEEQLLTERASQAKVAEETANMFVALTLLAALALVLAAVVIAEQFRARHVAMAREVSQRQAAESQQRSSDERLALALKAAPLTLSTTDQEGRYTWIQNVHPVFQHAEVLGLLDEELAPDGALQQLARLKRRALASGKGERETVAFRHDGIEEFFDVRAEPQHAADGSVKGLTVAAFNITPIIVAQRELQERERFTASILDNSGDCIEVLDHEGRVSLVNDPGLCLLEVENRTDVQGQLWVALWGERREKPEAALRAARAGTQARFQERSETAKGTSKWWDVIVTPVLDLEGSVAELVVISRDITEQRRLEDERLLALGRLQEREAQFRTLADTMPQIVWSTKADGYHDYFNERWYEYTGMPRPHEPGGEYDPSGTAQGWTWKNYLHPEDVGRTQEVWGHSLRTGEPYHIEYRFRRLDGAYRWFMGRALPLRNAEGTITRWFGTCTDIEEHKQSVRERESLLAAERAARSAAERAVRMKDEFVATLSHELRTPLNAILGWTQILRRESPAETSRKAIDVIERNARVQAQMVGDLLDTSRIISGKLRLELERLHLGDVIDAALASVEGTARAKEIALVPVVGAGDVVYGDPNRLQQVFWNLLANAIKFTPKGGTVQIVHRKVGSSIEVAVIDTGQGISSQFLPLVFDRFRQEDGSTSRRHGGLGLGLTIAKQIVEMHGGTVEVSSEGEGRGATFCVRLPIAPLVVAQSAMASVFDPRLHPQLLANLTVLVVDDEDDGRELVRRVLEDAGASVREASSAQTGMRALLAGDGIDVLLSDIGMPDEDGYAFIRRVRQLDGRRGRVAAAALTALARTEDRKRALLAGYQTHLAKPVDPGELVAVVASLAGRLGQDPSSEPL